jgi:hypothetical protein
LERHLQNCVFCLERADLITQCADDCLRIYVHVGNTNTYNGGMAEEEENRGALGGMPAKSGVKKEYENFTAKMAKAADIILSKGRACCGGRRV